MNAYASCPAPCRGVWFAFVLVQLALSTPLPAAVLESSASVCLAAGNCVAYPELGDADLGTTSAAAAVGGVSARSATDFGRYAAVASIDVTGIGPPAATARAYSIDTLTLSGSPGGSATVWFNYLMSGTIITQQPAVIPVTVNFEMSMAPTGQTLVVNPNNWTRRAGSTPGTLVFQDEPFQVALTLPYGVPYDVGASLRATASIYASSGFAVVDFFNTVRLTSVSAPAGATLSATSGTDYLNIGAPVPLPATLGLLAPSVLVLVPRRQRQSGRRMH